MDIKINLKFRLKIKVNLHKLELKITNYLKRNHSKNVIKKKFHK